MKFTSDISLKNVKRKPFRSAAMIILVAFLSLTVFGGAVMMLSLKNGLISYEARLGADIVVVPNSATGHGSLDDILLQGITGNYYMSGADYDKIKEIEGIEKISAQFYLTSAKSSCCSARVQIIGFDPQTDFSVKPWIAESFSGTISDGDLVVGANLNVPSDRKITFYNQEYTVVAKLGATGTGLDSAVYANMNTVKEMAENAAGLTETDAFKNVNINTAVSSVMIKVSSGYEISAVTDDVNIHVNKVKATSAKTMVSDISSGLKGVSTVIGVLTAAVWVLAVVILIISFVTVNNERKKEYAVLRALGASGKTVGKIMRKEAAIISGAGAIAGLIISLIILLPLSSLIKGALNLPYLMPAAYLVVILAAATVAAVFFAGIITSLFSAKKIVGSETGLLLREDA